VLACPVQERAAVAAIGLAVPQSGEPAAVQPPQQLHGAIAVAHIGGRHMHLDHQAEAVDQQVASLGSTLGLPAGGRWSSSSGVVAVRC
jgi:hypothetical protein